jgi:hypothetical protein
MMKVEPQPQHRWLAKLVGEWTYEGEALMGPGKPPEKFRGSETVRTLGEIWTLFEGRGEMPGGAPATMLITLGFDPERDRFTGTWIGSMMTHLWHYDGALDASQKVLTLESEGPSMAGDGKLAKYRDVIEVQSDNERTLTSLALDANGEWQRFMTATYRRKR